MKWGVEGGNNQGHFENLPRDVQEGFVSIRDEWFECSCKGVYP